MFSSKKFKEQEHVHSKPIDSKWAIQFESCHYKYTFCVTKLTKLWERFLGTEYVFQVSFTLQNVKASTVKAGVKKEDSETSSITSCDGKRLGLQSCKHKFLLATYLRFIEASGEM